MVVFGLFGINKSGPSMLNNREFDVLDELMGLNNKHTRDAATAINKSNNTNNDLDTSSFNLEEIMNRLSTKNENKSINYKDALMNSLYSQVDHLREESLRKDTLIEHLIKNTIIKPVAIRNYSSSVESITEISNPQENPFFNDYCNFNNSVIESNHDKSSLYSVISTAPLSTSTCDGNMKTNCCFESYDEQLSKYRYKQHWTFIEKKRKVNNDLQSATSQYIQSENNRIKDTLERIKNNINK